MLGNGRLEGHCFDGVTRLCHIRGKMRKKVWVNQGDIILIGEFTRISQRCSFESQAHSVAQYLIKRAKWILQFND